MSEKQPESDDTFNMLLQIFTVLYVAEKARVNNIIICGSPGEIADVISGCYKTKKIDSGLVSWEHPLRGLISRFKYLFDALYMWLIVKVNTNLPKSRPKVVFQGFWDWSIQKDTQDLIRDAYFKLLPEHLEKDSISYAWFLWLDPYFKCNSRKLRLKDILRPATNNPKCIFIQKFLTLPDILSAVLNFRFIFRYMRHSRSAEFRKIFIKDGVDFWPLMKRGILYNFCNPIIPHCQILESAYRKAFSFYKPELSMAFLDLFLAARAFYDGAKLGNSSTIRSDMLHAVYCREKTFISLDSRREFLGVPDGIKITTPNYFFVIGASAEKLLIDGGISSERLFPTGSARYEHIKISNGRILNRDDQRPIKFLLATARNIKLASEMIEAAFYASQGLNIKLCVRNHPLTRIEDIPAFKLYGSNITSSTSSLDEDLKSTDILIFTYSSVGEEAFLRGIPVIHWQPPSFNGSILKDLKIVPSAYSVKDLRQALISFLNNPESFVPKNEDQKALLRECFYKGDGLASVRIAKKVIEILKGYPH